MATMALDLMRESGQPPEAVEAFARLLGLYEAGDTGLLASSELEPAPEPQRLEDLPAADGLEGVVMIRLNGGLGTTMGLDGPKALIEVKPGLTLLDVIRRQSGAAPLVLMNSFATSEASRAAAPGAIELLQHRVPRLGGGWAPPGHGDLYTALHASGLRDELLARGLRTAFVANADNLG